MKFEITGKELESYTKWQEKHDVECDKYAGAIGGAVSYTFTPTSLGDIITIKCTACKTEINITDFDSW